MTPDISEVPQQRNHRIIVWVLIGLTLLGLALRLYLAWRTNQTLPDTPARLRGDEPGYERFAYDLLNGYFFERPGRTPVYPFFVAGCYAIFGRSPASVVYVQAFLGATIIPLTFILARRFTGAQSSLVAAGLIAIDPSLIFHVRRLQTEVLYTPLILLTVLGLLWALEQPQWQSFSLAGALLAITNLCRPTGMLLPAIVPLLMPREWHFKRKIALFIAYLGAVIIITAPWTYHNYRTHKTFLIYSVSTAILWQGSPEFYHLAYEKLPKRDMVQIWQEELNPERNGGHNAFTIEGDRYFTKRAIASILREPAVYLWYCLQKAVFFWLGNPVSDWPDHAMFNVEVMRRFFSLQQIVGILASRIWPVFAALGMIVLRHRWREFLPLLLVCAYFTFIHALTYAEVRYSEPLHPILAVVIATAAGELQRRLKLISQ
ncbi:MULTISPECIES: glycosyltransferase family 39 protein [unclassified Microcoleus]|uniref:glycosyltransferase family 39 protein n=1 Tax=unclassified Microcoleus TaxID=2642155 RepID=UPI002FCFEAC4